MIRVTVENPRPDFRVFVDLVYGYGRNVDTEGDSNPIYSRTWRDLYIKDRESEDPSIEIYSEDNFPLIFEIDSKSKRLEELAAIYMYNFCGTSIANENGIVSKEEIETLRKKYTKEISRANESIWHQSSEINEYPNLA